MDTASLIRKRVRRREARSAVGKIAARIGSFVVRRRVDPLIPLAPFDDV